MNKIKINFNKLRLVLSLQMFIIKKLYVLARLLLILLK
jgi:hypothetical protein